MVPRPTSPTSLLWAHELERQHGFLMDRMKIVEGHMMAVQAANEDLEDRVKGIEADNKVLRKVAESYKDFPKRLLQRVEQVEKENSSLRVEMKQLSEAGRKEDDAKFKKLMRKVTALEELEKQNSAKCTTLTKQVEAADTAKREEIGKREIAQHEFEALRTKYEHYRKETDDEILRLSLVCSQDKAAVARMKKRVEELSQANQVTNVLAQDTERRLHVLENSTTNQVGPEVQSNQGRKRFQPVKQVDLHRDKEDTPISQASTLIESRDKDELVIWRQKKPAKANVVKDKQVQAITQDIRQTKSVLHANIPAQPAQQKRRAPSPSATLQPTDGNRGVAQDPVRPVKKRRQFIQENSYEDLLVELQYPCPTCGGIQSLREPCSLCNK